MKRFFEFFGTAKVIMFAAGILSTGFGIDQWRLPLQPQKVMVDLPPNTAALLPSTRVTPGTFKISLPLEEFFEKAKTTPGAIIMFGPGYEESEKANCVELNYWLPVGSVFYFSQKQVTPKWPHSVTIGEVRYLGKNELLVTPARDSEIIGIAFFLAFVCFAFVAVLHYLSTES